MSNVKGYTDKQLLEKVKSLPSYGYIPKGYWLLGVQSNEDAYNQFDDKIYLFKGEKFVMVAPATTNAGKTGLMSFNKYNHRGCAVIKTNEWYYYLWRPGKHRGRMEALRQVSKIKYYRDKNRNKKAEQTGKLYEGIIGINFHTVSYFRNMSLIRQWIGGWSVGCQVIPSLLKYYSILSRIEGQQRISYVLIDEF